MRLSGAIGGRRWRERDASVEPCGALVQLIVECSTRVGRDHSEAGRRTQWFM